MEIGEEPVGGREEATAMDGVMEVIMEVGKAMLEMDGVASAVTQGKSDVHSADIYSCILIKSLFVHFRADDDGSVWNPQPAPAPAPAPAPTPAPASAPPKASTTTRQAPAPTTRIANPVLATSAATSTSKHIITLAQPASADNPASAVPESAGQGINSEAGNASLSDGVSSIVNPDERVVAEASPAVPSSVDLSGAQQQTSEESDSSLPAAAVKQKDDSESQNEKEKEKTDSNTDPSWYVTSQDFSLGRSAAYTTTSHPTSLLLYSFALLVVAFLLLQ